MKKLLIIAPHLSTGGMPQYLVKQIESFKDEYDIYCIEWTNITGGVLVVQRNRIQNMLGDKLITLGEDKSSIVNIMNDINPDIIHFQEIPENFIDYDILNIIYRFDRDYFILVTTHSSYTDPRNIKFMADRFVLVSEWSKNIFVNHFGEDMCDIWEYPVEKITYDKDFYKKELEFDLDKKHILHVGLFTPGKNQKDIIELARICKDDNFIFHFVGNQAENFRGYWEPLMLNFPDNCIWHGERADVDKFYMASDLFYFPSLFELNPLSVKEALSYSLPVMINKLDTYNGSYDYFGQISSNQYENRNNIIEIFNDVDETVVLVLAHPNNENNKKLLKNCLSGFEYDVILSTNYKVDEETQEMCNHVIYTRENQLLSYKDYSKYGVSYKYWYVNELGERYEQYFDCNHSYAVYRLIQNGINYANMIGKKKVHIINYDYEISNSTLSYINSVLNKKDLMLYREGDLYLTGFFSGKIDALSTYFNKHNSIKDFYTAYSDFNTLERQVYEHFTNSEYTIESKDISELYAGNKVNQYEYDSVLLFEPEKV